MRAYMPFDPAICPDGHPCAEIAVDLWLCEDMLWEVFEIGGRLLRQERSGAAHTLARALFERVQEVKAA